MLNMVVEKERFERVAYRRTLGAAWKAFKKWHWRKRDHAVAEMMGKMWDQWIRLVKRGKDPEPKLGALIQWGSCGSDATAGSRGGHGASTCTITGR